MPNINLDDAYVLDETGAQVDQVTGLYSKNENASDTEKAQARANIGAGGSNDNLLDNWYFVGGGSQLGDGVFPINQRGQTSYQIQGTTIDRWKSNSPWGSIANLTLEEGGLVIAGRIETSYPTSYVQLSQVIKTPPVGKTVTLSVLCDNVSPDSEGNYPQIWCGSSVNKRITAAGLTSLTFAWPSAENSIGIVLDNGATQAASIRLQAVKLELGSVSTLANDAPPDYGTELIKCRGYFERIHSLGSSEIVGMGMGASDSSVRIGIPSLICHTIQIVTYSGGGLLLEGGGNYRTLTSIGKLNATPKNGFLTVTCGSSDAITPYQTYALVGTSAGGYIDISADL